MIRGRGAGRLDLYWLLTEYLKVVLEQRNSRHDRVEVGRPGSVMGTDAELMLALKMQTGTHAPIIMAGPAGTHLHSGHNGTDDSTPAPYRERTRPLDGPQHHKGQPAQQKNSRIMGPMNAHNWPTVISHVSLPACHGSLNKTWTPIPGR